VKANKDLLAKRGMSESLLGDIEATIKAFEHTLEATRTGRATMWVQAPISGS
jgi:hypothetical protein